MTTTTRYIAKCKGCKTFTSTIASNVNRANAEMGALIFDQTGESGCVGNLAIRCRCCGKARAARPVRGIVNMHRECNAKCMASHGTVCECSCGGKNHGGSYSAVA